MKRSATSPLAANPLSMRGTSRRREGIGETDWQVCFRLEH